MQAGNFVSGALLAVGLMLVGCGGPTVEDTGAQDLTSREALVPNCSDTTEGFISYSNAQYTQIVGYSGCGCGRWTRWGQSTQYSIVTDLCVPPQTPEA